MTDDHIGSVVTEFSKSAANSFFFTLFHKISSKKIVRI